MTSLPRLSSIRKIHPRTVWPNEAGDFTPWLERNIGELSMTLGMSLRVEATEVQAGTRYIDLVATDTGSGRPVVIENQLENSDGDHLSRMLFYAASKDADTIIWIAREFEEEHWRTLKWLNQRTQRQTRFFGIAVEVWRIENSPPAPHFRVVVAPDDWRRGLPRSLSRNERPQFWQALESKIKQDYPDAKSSEEHTHPWYVIDYAGGVRYSFDTRDGFTLALQFDTRLTIVRRLESYRNAFDELRKERAFFEQELGSLIWDREWYEDWGSQIVSHYPSNFYNPMESSNDLHAWAVKQYGLFRKVFDPKTKEISCDSPVD